MMISNNISHFVRDAAGEQTNPTAAGSALADTGAITKSGFYEVIITASASANAQFVVQHRNSANSGNVSDVYPFYILANSVGQFRDVFFVNENERIRVMMDNDLTGTASVNVTAMRIQ